MPRLLFRNTWCATFKKTKQTKRRKCEPLSKEKTTLRCPRCWNGHTGAVKQLLGPEMPNTQPNRCHRSPKKTGSEGSGPLVTGEDCPTEYRKAALHVAKEMRSKKEKRISKDRFFQGIWEGSRQSDCRKVWVEPVNGRSHQEEGTNGHGQGK